MPAATATLLDDSAVNIDEWIASEVELTFAVQEGAAFVIGDGTNKFGFSWEDLAADTLGALSGLAIIHYRLDDLIGFRAGWGFGNALFISTALATIGFERFDSAMRAARMAAPPNPVAQLRAAERRVDAGRESHT